MNKNNFILKFLLASVVCLLFVVGIIYLFVWGNNNKLQGKLVFSDTYNRGTLIDRIENSRTTSLNMELNTKIIERNSVKEINV